MKIAILAQTAVALLNSTPPVYGPVYGVSSSGDTKIMPRDTIAEMNIYLSKWKMKMWLVWESGYDPGCGVTKI